MKKSLFIGGMLLATLFTGCGKSPEAIVNDAYKSASENKFENIAAYVLPDSIDPFTEVEVQSFGELASNGVGMNSYASFSIDSVVTNSDETEAVFSVKTNFKDGRSYTETGRLRKTAKGNWRLMVDKEASDSTDVFSTSDREKITPELMRNLRYATIMTLASRGLPQYQILAAEYIKDGIMTYKDNERALELLKSAAEENYVPAYLQLAKMYYDGGKGLQQDYEKAFEWYLKAAEAGDVKAYGQVGLAYREGKGTIKNLDKAKEWFEKGIEHEDPGCYRWLGYMYGPWFKGFETDGNKCFELWSKGYEAAVKAGDKKEIAASAGNIGFCYSNGFGVEKDIDKEIEWYTKGAEAGDSIHMSNLGKVYYFGQGVPKDYDKAFYWYSKAAKEGQLDALLYLGECYEYGRGVAMNKTKALEIYRDLVQNHNYSDAKRGYYRLL